MAWWLTSSSSSPSWPKNSRTSPSKRRRGLRNPGAFLFLEAGRQGQPGRENVEVRWIFWLLLLSLPVLAKVPAVVPQNHFTIKLPKDWISPAPNQWTSLDGALTFAWSETQLGDTDLDAWLAACRKVLPGTPLGEPQKMEIGGRPAWTMACEYHGRIQRLYWCSNGTLFVSSCQRTQSFAAIAMVSDAFQSLRWLDQVGLGPKRPGVKPSHRYACRSSRS